MREILFKAKRIDNGEWVEGFLFKTQEHTYIAYGRQFDDDLFISPQNIFIMVDKDTICQYTGLTDKNGNKIWENDVVKHYNNPNEPTQFVIGAIYWNEDNVRYERSSKYEHAKFSVLYDCVYEVIGNIFDNPELKGGAE